jgi:hypothetical protein
MRSPAIIFTFGLALLATACRTGDNIVQPTYIVTGQWELRHLSGSLAGFDSSFAPGNGRTLSFSGTTYQQYAGGALVRSGSYQITKDTSYLTNTLEDMIAFDGGLVPTVLKIAHDTMFLSQDVNDGVNSIYKRIDQ